MMRILAAIAALGLLAIVPAGAQESATPLKTDKDKQSYGVGVQLGSILKAQGVDVDSALVLKGLNDALAGGKLMMTDDELRATMTALQQQVNQREEEQKAAAAVNNKKEGETFLAGNKTKEGVVTLPSGLQYKVLTAGTGPKPTATDTVLCNYKGTLVDGTEFDSSYKRGEPATFGVGQVIHGWTEALQLMPVGSKWQLFVPSDLAYGTRGRPGIEPNAMLIFEVELLSIQGKDAKDANDVK